MRSKAEFRHKFVQEVRDHCFGLVLDVFAGLPDLEPDHCIRDDGLQRFQQRCHLRIHRARNPSDGIISIGQPDNLRSDVSVRHQVHRSQKALMQGGHARRIVRNEIRIDSGDPAQDSILIDFGKLLSVRRIVHIPIQKQVGLQRHGRIPRQSIFRIFIGKHPRREKPFRREFSLEVFERIIADFPHLR